MSLHRKWLFGGVAAAILTFLLGFFLLVNPARNQAAALYTEAENLNQNNAALEAKLAQLEQQSTEIPAKLEEIEAAKLKMPSEVKQPELVRTIESEAASAGVDLTTLTPGTPVALEGSTTGTIALPMGIEAKGRYANVKTFVDNLERLDRAFLIKSVDVTVEDEATDSFALTLEGQFYSLPAGTLDTPGVGSSSDSPAGGTTATPAPSAAAAAQVPKAAGKDSSRKDGSGEQTSGGKASGKESSSKTNSKDSGKD